MVETLLVREATVEDAEAIMNLHVASIRGLCKSHYTAEEIRSWTWRAQVKTYRDAIRSSFETLYVAELAEPDGPELVGFSALAPRELRALYLSPAYAGRGLGKRLLERTEALAREQGMKALYLDASLNAVAFYTACGYQILREASVVLPDGTELPSLRMKKVLVPAQRGRR